VKRTTNFRKHDIRRTDRPDGTILLESNVPQGPVVSQTSDWLHKWGQEANDRVFLAERSGKGWREETYGSTLQKVKALASSLLARGLNKDTPILIMSGNGVDHGLLALAAQYVGVPTVPVAEQYSLIPSALGRLVQVVKLVHPAMVYVSDAAQFAQALGLDELEGMEIVASQTGGVSSTKITLFDDLLRGDDGVDMVSANAAVSPDTVAKILMTSGSTSAPKGVLTTHGMLCTNQTQIADALPFLHDRPPRILDWLPWNHVFGGSHNFNMMLANGGSLYIDGGKPAKGLFEQTLENLSLITGTLSFNVPAGFSMLLNALQKDLSLQQRFFENLDMIFYAGASLPQYVWEGFENLSMKIKGEVPLMTSSWGLTETAPAMMIQQEPTASSGVVGIPMTGTVTKLVPNDENRFEVRVKGPNVMAGYFEDPVKTTEAFDDEGFFITGDAMCFADPDDPNKGLRFDGRISEDFKLLTGTWVRAAQLRLDALAHFGPLASDIVVAGADRHQIGMLVFPNLEEVRNLGFEVTTDNGALNDPDLLAVIQNKLEERAGTVFGSSNTVARAIVVSEPASLADGEITAKGNLNFRKVLSERKHLLQRLYDDNDTAVAKL